MTRFFNKNCPCNSSRQCLLWKKIAALHPQKKESRPAVTPLEPTRSSGSYRREYRYASLYAILGSNVHRGGCKGVRRTCLGKGMAGRTYACVRMSTRVRWNEIYSLPRLGGSGDATDVELPDKLCYSHECRNCEGPLVVRGSCQPFLPWCLQASLVSWLLLMVLVL
jgi:hypothetical protein